MKSRESLVKKLYLLHQSGRRLPIEESGKRRHAAEILRHIEDFDAVSQLVSRSERQQGAADKSESEVLVPDHHIYRSKRHFDEDRIG